MKDEFRCIRPSRVIKRLLIEFMNDELTKPGREVDNEKLRQHLVGCAFCRDILVEHANETVLTHLIEEEAKKLGVPVKKFKKILAAQIEKEAGTGRIHRRYKHRE